MTDTQTLFLLLHKHLQPFEKSELRLYHSIIVTGKIVPLGVKLCFFGTLSSDVGVLVPVKPLEYVMSGSTKDGSAGAKIETFLAQFIGQRCPRPSLFPRQSLAEQAASGTRYPAPTLHLARVILLLAHAS